MQVAVRAVTNSVTNQAAGRNSVARHKQRQTGRQWFGQDFVTVSNSDYCASREYDGCYDVNSGGAIAADSGTTRQY